MNFYNSFIKTWNSKFPNTREPNTIDCLKADKYSSLNDQRKAFENLHNQITNEITEIQNQLNQSICYANFIKSSMVKLSSIAHLFLDDNLDTDMAHSTADDDIVKSDSNNSFLTGFSSNFVVENFKTEEMTINISNVQSMADANQQVNSTENDLKEEEMSVCPMKELSDNEVEEMMLKCNNCPRTFQSKLGLELHEKVHTGERPFECDVCGRAFKLKAQLQTHERVHSGERPFGCRICGKLFRQQCHVVQHLRCHTGEKPHSCTKCGKQFRQKHSLVSHINRKCQSTRRSRNCKIPVGSTVWIGLSDGNDSKSFVKEIMPPISSTPVSSVKTIVSQNNFDDSSSLCTNFNDDS